MLVSFRVIIDSRYIAVRYNTIMHTTQQFVMVKLRPDVALINDTPYLALMCELWGVFCEFFKEKLYFDDLSRAHCI